MGCSWDRRKTCNVEVEVIWITGMGWEEEEEAERIVTWSAVDNIFG